MSAEKMPSAFSKDTHRFPSCTSTTFQTFLPVLRLAARTFCSEKLNSLGCLCSWWRRCQRPGAEALLDLAMLTDVAAAQLEVAALAVSLRRKDYVHASPLL